MAPHLRGRYRVATLGRGASNDIRADLSESVPELGGRFDVVVHAAALAHPSRHTLPDDYMAVNVDGTRRLCESLEHAGVPRSLIFLSSVAVYGCDDGAAGVDESWPLAGTSPYARSKSRMVRDPWRASGHSPASGVVGGGRSGQHGADDPRHIPRLLCRHRAWLRYAQSDQCR